MSTRTAIALAALAALGPSCGGPHRPELQQAPPLPSLSVRAVRAIEASEALRDEVVGTVRARNVTAVSASVMGTVRTLKFSLGSRVRRGELLVQLGAAEIEAKAAQAQAMLDRAEIDFGRARHLVAGGSITTAEFDATAAQLRIAQAALAEAEAMRGYMLIRAPISGVVTAKQCELGDLALPGKPLLVIESLDALRLEAAVPEAVAHALSLGDVMAVRIDALGRELEGKLEELDPSSEADSHTVLAKLDLPVAPELRPGMFGRLLLRTGEAMALTVPRDAIVERGQMELVYVVAQGAARLRIVRTGKQYGDRVELLAGLERGETVIVDHPELLVDGQPVQVVP
jgi:multidrug efflux system membrane fusion protein